MPGTRLLHSIRPRNILSYGPQTDQLELLSLNVVIGPNASGKSNLIETVSLLRGLPQDLSGAIREGGGISEWLWKGGPETSSADIDIVVSPQSGVIPLRYRIAFAAVGQRLEIVDEIVEDVSLRDPSAAQPFFYYRFQEGSPVLSALTVHGGSPASDPHRRDWRRLRREDVKPGQSILSQRIDRDQYPEITYLNEELKKIFVFRGVNFGRRLEARRPQPTDLPEDFLLPDASNLALILNDLQHRGLKPKILDLLRTFSDGIEDLTIRIYGGSAQIYLHERGLSTPISANRLSDGTMQFLCLLAILCHPNPPRLVCLEEPEVGQHPDIIRMIAELLVEASERTQLIVTTHSDHLVSALAATPEVVAVCEKDDGKSVIRRLDAQKLEKWLEQYSLGELWLSGEIGGTRW